MAFRTITLFTEPPPARQGPSTFVVSMVFHAATFALLISRVWHPPQILERQWSERYQIRMLNLHNQQKQLQRASDGGIQAPAQSAKGEGKESKAGGNSSPEQAQSHEIAELKKARQTLVQPDIPPNAVLPELIPLPQVLLWQAENVKVKQIVPAAPLKITAADVRPSLLAPNREKNLADVKIASSAFTTETLAHLPSSTSPIQVKGPQPAQQIPETSSETAAAATPARVMSISDIRMPEGAIALPPVNQTASSNNAGGLGSGQSDKPASAGKGAGTGAGEGAGNQGANGTGAAGSQLAQNGANVGPQHGAEDGFGAGAGPTTKRVVAPKDGQYGVVVVGSSLADKYPETEEMWQGRMAATVYLHVGSAKSWILQYSLPRSAEAEKLSAGRVEAPWPYDMVRPDLAPGDLDADALMVHGTVNKSGRFETLAVVFPTQFPQTKFVLDALKQWQFRPARQDGQSLPVEVLLIIPSELD